MRIPSLLLTFAAALLLTPAPGPVLHAQTAPAGSSTSTAASTATSARVIVKYKADSPLLRRSILHATREDIATELSSRAQALGQRVGMTLATGRAITERSHVLIADGIGSQQLAAKIAAQPDVEYAVPDQRRRRTEVPTDPLYHTNAVTPANNPTSGGPLVGQWYLKPPVTTSPSPRTADSSAPSAINAQQAWDVTQGSASIVVAVIDTGIRFDHKDFKLAANGGNVLPGYDMISNSATANDGDGRDSDASDPGDFVTSQDVSGPNPVPGCTNNDVGNSSWHGTETAGLIGAQTNNALGIASVGHGNVRILPVRVLGKCGGLDSDIVAGMLWASGIDVPGVPHNTTPARVLNMSLGGSGTCDAAGGAQPYVDAMAQITAAGGVVVAAAGNSTGHAVGVPANCPGVIGVAGLRHIGTKVGFSDLGPEISIAAPGGNCINTNPGTECVYPIVTTTNSGSTTPVSDANGGSIYSTSFGSGVPGSPSLGTSFSAPLVAGTAALMLSVQPQLRSDEVRFKLQHSARAFPQPTVDEGGNALTACTPPNGIDQLQCVCNTALCGAGMLDAYHAVLEANGAQARVTVLTANAVANSAVQFSGGGSLVGPSGAPITNYQWTIADGGGIVTALTPPTSGASATTVSATPVGAGTFSVTLTVTDANGIVSAESASVSVSDPNGSVPTGGGGGGGALGIAWLAMLLAAVLALAALSKRRT